MNEQIKFLAEQAGITTNLDTDFFEQDMNKWVDYYSQKFAELIVDECCLKLLDMDEKAKGNHNYYKHAAIQIKRHFKNEE